MAARPFSTFTATGTNGDKLTYNMDELPEGTTIYAIPQEGTPYEYRLQRDSDNNLAWFAYRDGKTVNPHHGNSGTTIVRYALQRPRHATVITTPTRAKQEKNTTSDWAGVQFQPISPLPRSLKLTSEDAMREVLTWVGALWANSVLRVGAVKNRKVDWDNLELHADPDNIYEIAFHSVWGLDSLPREAAESYGSAQNALSMHLRYWGDCTVEDRYDEWDETYLTHLQRLYDIDRLPWPTKTVLTLRRSG